MLVKYIFSRKSYGNPQKAETEEHDNTQLL
jgi:hypothetical protein